MEDILHVMMIRRWENYGNGEWESFFLVMDEDEII